MPRKAAALTGCIIAATLACTRAPSLECAEAGLADNPTCQEYCAWQEQSGFSFCDCPQACDRALELGLGLGGSECQNATLEVLECSMSVAPAEEWDECADTFGLLKEACQQGRHVLPGWGACHAQCDLAEFCGYGDYYDWGDCYVKCWSNLDIDASQGCFAQALGLKTCIVDQLRDGCRSVGAACKDEESAWEQCVTW